MNKKQLMILCVLLCIVLGVLSWKYILFGHRYVYRYEFGVLSTQVAHLWAGPFTKASFGSQEAFQHERKALPNVFVVFEDGFSVRLSEMQESDFNARFGPTSQRRYDGYSRGIVGDAEFDFKGGRLRYLLYSFVQGWPCFAKKRDGRRFCFPLSRSAAEELFGFPVDSGRKIAPWI